jgi:hypothetical protein
MINKKVNVNIIAVWRAAEGRPEFNLADFIFMRFPQGG